MFMEKYANTQIRQIMPAVCTPLVRKNKTLYFAKKEIYYVKLFTVVSPPAYLSS